MATSGQVRNAGGGTARSRRDVWFPPRHSHTSETKPFFLTSEFLVFVAYLIGFAITALTSDTVDARYFWLLTTGAVAAYMIARGVAKSGSRSNVPDPRDDIDMGHRG